VTIADARACLIRGDLDGALTILLELWREQRSGAVADAIDAIDASGSTEPIRDTAAWVRAAKRAGSLERGRLLRSLGKTSIELRARLEIAMRWRDPRLTRVLVELLRALPFTGKKTRPVWSLVFEAIRALDDPRAIVAAKEAEAGWRLPPDTMRFLASGLAKATNEISPGRTLSSRDAAELGALVAAVEQTKPPRTAIGPDHGDALRAAIYAAPDDDGPRSVYADWLQQHDDPYGEFIALQLQPELDAVARKREATLLKQHRKQWLGPLAPVLIGTPRFQRGFPVAAVVKFRHEGDVARYAGEPAWSTFEELTWSDHIVADGQERWTRFVHPAMRSLRIAHGVGPEQLLASDTPWRQLETVRTSCADEPTLRGLLEMRNLPRLRRLVLASRLLEPGWFAGNGGPVEITLLDRNPAFDDVQWAIAANQRAVERLTLMHGYYGPAVWELTRDLDGDLTRLSIEMRPEPPTDSLATEPRVVARMVYLVNALTPGWLTSFQARVEVNGALVTSATLERLGASKLRT